MGVLYERVVWFPWVLGEGWVQESVYDGVDQQVVHHILSSH